MRRTFRIKRQATGLAYHESTLPDTYPTRTAAWRAILRLADYADRTDLAVHVAIWHKERAITLTWTNSPYHVTYSVQEN